MVWEKMLRISLILLNKYIKLEREQFTLSDHKEIQYKLITKLLNKEITGDIKGKPLF